MTTIQTTNGGNHTAPSFTSSGAGGLGFVLLPPQSSTPATPASGIAIHSTNSSRFAYVGMDGFARIFSDSNNASRTYALPNISDTISTTTSTETLQNKTITGGATGNVVSANQLQSRPVNATLPTASQVLTYISNEWVARDPIVTAGNFGFALYKSGSQERNTTLPSNLTGWTAGAYGVTSPSFNGTSFTVPVTGYWQVDSRVIWDIDNGSGLRITAIRIDGSNHALGDVVVASTTLNPTNHIHGAIYLTVGMVVTHMFQQTSVGSGFVLDTQEFSLIGTTWSMYLLPIPA